MSETDSKEFKPTPEVVREYVESGGAFCLKCGSPDTVWEPKVHTNAGPTSAWWVTRCTHCGYVWQDVLRLTTVDLMDQATEEVTDMSVEPASPLTPREQAILRQAFIEAINALDRADDGVLAAFAEEVAEAETGTLVDYNEEVIPTEYQVYGPEFDEIERKLRVAGVITLPDPNPTHTLSARPKPTGWPYTKPD